MLRIILILLFYSSSALSEVKIYDNSYKNIHVGITPIHEVLETFGKPKKITEYKNNINYLFPGVKITALKNTGRVSTISIFNKSYTDPNGVKVGFGTNRLESIFRVKITREYFADKTKGIIYWLRKGRVNKIVLARELKVS